MSAAFPVDGNLRGEPTLREVDMPMMSTVRRHGVGGASSSPKRHAGNKSETGTSETTVTEKVCHVLPKCVARPVTQRWKQWQRIHGQLHTWHIMSVTSGALCGLCFFCALRKGLCSRQTSSVQRSYVISRTVTRWVPPTCLLTLQLRTKHAFLLRTQVRHSWSYTTRTKGGCWLGRRRLYLGRLPPLATARRGSL